MKIESKIKVDHAKTGLKLHNGIIQCVVFKMCFNANSETGENESLTIGYNLRSDEAGLFEVNEVTIDGDTSVDLFLKEKHAETSTAKFGVNLMKTGKKAFCGYLASELGLNESDFKLTSK